MNIAQNNIIPATNITYTEHSFDDKKIAVIDIPKENDITNL